MKKKPLSERIGTTKEKITKVDAKTGKVSASLTNAQKRWKHYHDGSAIWAARRRCAPRRG